MTEQTTSPAAPERHVEDWHKHPFGANEVRLSARQWALALAVAFGILALLPVVWPRIEPFNPGDDYRVPFEWCEDYWLYDRYAGLAVQQDRIPVVGDSVIWGMYVYRNQTLSCCLNRKLGQTRFANLGVNGIHPLAMEGLVSYYGGAVADRKAVLHFNPLWMTSKKADLVQPLTQKDRDSGDDGINHRTLIPQFFPAIPRYEADGTSKVSILMRHRVPTLRLFNHIVFSYLGGRSVPAWTTPEWKKPYRGKEWTDLDQPQGNPYGNPFAQITLNPREPEDKLHQDVKQIPWNVNEASRMQSDFQWVAPADSLQWGAFKRTLETLLSRGNDVFVLVGPFNEHKMLPESLEVYRGIQKEVAGYLEAKGVPHAVPEVLPTELYGDTSHPLPEGYKLMAERLLEDPAFSKWLNSGGWQAE